VGNNQTLPETLTNSGGSTLTVTQVNPIGTSFSVSGLNLPLTLLAGQNQPFNVTFTPAFPGNSSGNLAIVNTGSIPTVNVVLSGNGLAAGALTASPSSLGFGNVQVANNLQLSETLTNSGGVDVNISQATIAGTSFSMSGLNPPLLLTPGQHYTFTVTFTPPTPGNYTGSVSIVSDASKPNLGIPLTGTGTPPPSGQLSVTPTTMDFGNVVVGTDSRQTGTLSATVASITVTSGNVDASPFALSGLSFPVTVPAGQHVQFTVTFAPQRDGTASGSISFASDALNSPTIESLTGNGTLPLPVVPASFFGLIVHRDNHFPASTFSFGGFRFWDDLAIWPYIEAPDSFKWKSIDDYLSSLHDANVNTILYTLGTFPPWAAGNSNDKQPCDNVQGKIFPHNCDPPPDLNPDGTGTDQTWRNWVAAIATHVNKLDPDKYAHIEYWEPWNEFYRSDTLQPGYHETPISWHGTYAQMVRITQDLNCIVTGRIQAITTNSNETCDHVLASVGLTAPVDSSAKVVSPSGCANEGFFSFATEQNYLYCNDNPPTSAYCTTGRAGADAVDIINIHGYTGREPVERSLQTWANKVKNGLQSQELGKPLILGEGSFGDPAKPGNGFTDLQSQASVVARYSLMARSLGVSTEYWYGYETEREAVGSGGIGTLVMPDGYQGCNDPNGCILPSGTAWQQTYDWMVGATMSMPCSSQGSVWTCSFTRTNPSGYQAEATWDNSATYYCDGNGNCPTHSVGVSAVYTQYRDLAGNIARIANNAVPIGLLPILLENQ
jgi:hypothetical protein